MEFRFSVVAHGDLSLEYGGTYLNMGYHYNTKLPLMMWLFNLQVASENIFADADVFESDPPYEIERLVQEAEEIGCRLPLDEREFYAATMMSPGFARFTNGANRVSYDFGLVGEVLKLTATHQASNEPVHVLDLNIDDSRRLTEAYLTFLETEPKLVKFKGEVAYAMARLKRI